MHTAVRCTDCRKPIALSDIVRRTVSSSLEQVPFHRDCYRKHVPAQRDPLDDLL